MTVKNALLPCIFSALIGLSLNATADPYQEAFNNKSEAQHQSYLDGVEAGEDDRLNGERGAECDGAKIEDIFFQYGYREGFFATTPDYDKLACVESET